MGLPMDEVAVEIAPGADLTADPSTWTWVDLCAHTAAYPDGRVQRPVTIQKGRGSESGSSRPSSCTFEVRNEDGALTAANPLSPYYPDLGKGTPLRVTWGSSERFFGFISELPTTWLGIVGNSRVQIRAEGVTRRLEQGAPSLRSALFRSLSQHENVVAYWPCEEPSGSSRAFSPIDGVLPWRLPGEFAAIEGPAGSDQLFRAVEGESATLAAVPGHTPGDVYVAQVAFRMDEAPTAGREMLNVFSTSATLSRWMLSISDTLFRVQAWDEDGTQVVDDSEAVHDDVIGQWVRVELRLQQNTAVTWSGGVYTMDPGWVALNDLSGSVASSSMGCIGRVGVGHGGIWGQDRYFGHLAVLTGTAAELPPAGFVDVLGSNDRHAPYHGWTGERAADRFERLCEEEGLTCTVLAPTGGLAAGASTTDSATTPDTAALDITGDIDIRCWLAMDDWTPGDAVVLFYKWVTTGNQRSWLLQLGTGGELELLWSTDGTSGTVSTVGTGVRVVPSPGAGSPLAIRVTLDVNNGAAGHDVSFEVGPSLDGPWTVYHSRTIAGTTSIFSSTAPLTVLGDVNYGSQVRAARVYSGIAGTLVADPDFTAQAIGAASFNDDAGNTWTVNGDAAIVRADDSMPMGPQQINTLVANLRDVEATDGGRLYEDAGGLVYRTIADLYNQTATEVDFCDLNGAPQLLDDDSALRNDVTATRPVGGEARLVDQDHIDAHGRYDTQYQANTENDDQLRQVAGWQLHLGTSEAPRWPLIPVKIDAETQHLLTDVFALGIGDRLSIPHDVPQLPGVEVDLLVEGWTESIFSRRAELVFNCTPALPYQVAVFGTARFDAVGSATSGSFDAGTDTSLTVVTQAGSRPWINSTDHAAEFPFTVKIAGVVLEVTGITGSTSPQTFSVTQQPVNGVEKTIPSGSAVALAPTPVFAL